MKAVHRSQYQQHQPPSGRMVVLWRLPTPLVPSQFQHSNSTLYSSTVHCVKSLYINRYVCSNKQVLSELLSRLLLVHTTYVDNKAADNQRPEAGCQLWEHSTDNSRI